MRKAISVAAMFAVAVVVFGVSQVNAAQWKTDYRKALESARQNNRPLLVVFEQPQVEISAISAKAAEGSSLEALAHYELCRIDTTTIDGQAVAEAFRVDGTPYLVITDKFARHIVYRKSGEMSPRQWQTTLAAYDGVPRPAPQPVVLRSAEVEATAPVSRSRRRICFT